MSNDTKKFSINSEDLGTKEWEDSIIKPLKIMNWFTLLICIIIFVLPSYVSDGWLHLGIYKFVVLLIIGIGSLSRNGRIFNFTPLPIVLGLRGFQILLNLLIFHKSFYYIPFFISMFLELIICGWFLYDENHYVYKTEREDLNELYQYGE